MLPQRYLRNRFYVKRCRMDHNNPYDSQPAPSSLINLFAMSHKLCHVTTQPITKETERVNECVQNTWRPSCHCVGWLLSYRIWWVEIFCFWTQFQTPESVRYICCDSFFWDLILCTYSSTGDPVTKELLIESRVGFNMVDLNFYANYIPSAYSKNECFKWVLYCARTNEKGWSSRRLSALRFIQMSDLERLFLTLNVYSAEQWQWQGYDRHRLKIRCPQFQIRPHVSTNPE